MTKEEIIIYEFSLFCKIFIIIIIPLFISKKTKNKNKQIENKFKYYCCFCSMGKKENLYSRELISYYMSIGVDKFVFGDNNLINTEKLSDIYRII